MTGIYDTTHLDHCRRTLAEAEIDLRSTRDMYEAAKAQAEHRAIAAMNGSAGKNEEERKRNLALKLLADRDYQRALTRLREAEAAVTTAQMEYDVACDQRRAEEWGIRLQLVIALDRQRVTSEQPGDDTSFEDAADDAAWAAGVQF